MSRFGVATCNFCKKQLFLMLCTQKTLKAPFATDIQLYLHCPQKLLQIKATKTNVFIPWNHQHTLLVSKSSVLLLAKQSPSSLQKTHWWLDKTVCKNDKKGKINTAEALLTGTLISGQLNLWPPSQNPVFLNYHTNSVFLHPGKQPASVTDTFFTFKGVCLWQLPL